MVDWGYSICCYVLQPDGVLAGRHLQWVWFSLSYCVRRAAQYLPDSNLLFTVGHNLFSSRQTLKMTTVFNAPTRSGTFCYLYMLNCSVTFYLC